MSYVTLMMTAVGVMISSVAGLICYLGQLPGDLTMDWLPFGAELLAHPEASLGLGAVIIVTSILCQPSRIH